MPTPRGRAKGVPNKVTTRARQIFNETWHRLTPEIEDWIRRTAEGEPVPMIEKNAEGMPVPVLDQAGNPILIRKGADPKGAVDIMLRYAKFHVPELERHTVDGTGADGAIRVIVKTEGE